MLKIIPWSTALLVLYFLAGCSLEQKIPDNSYNVAVTGGSADGLPTNPVNLGDPVSISVYGYYKNKGKDLEDNIISVCYFVLCRKPKASYNAIIADGYKIFNTANPSIYAAGDSDNFGYGNQDITGILYRGTNNYVYILVNLVNYDTGEVIAEPDTSDNAYQLNSNPIVLSPGAFPGWSDPITLAGGASIDTAILLSSPSNWYLTSPAFWSSQWYKANVTVGKKYLFSWDDASEGSGLYYDDLLVSFYRADKTTAIGTDIDNAYNTPFIVTAEDSVIYIQVFRQNGGYSAGSATIGYIPEP